MAELLTFGETPLRFSPPGNQRLEMARETTIYADGTASNVAVAAHELGAEPIWLSKLPETPLGRRVETQLEEQGIETHIAWSDDGELRQGLLFRESGAAPRESQCWHDRGHTAAATAKPADFPMETVQNTETIFTGLGTAVLSEQAAKTTGALLRAAGGGGAMTAVSLDYSAGLAPPATYSGVLDTLADDFETAMEILHSPGTLFSDPTTELVDHSMEAMRAAGQEVTQLDFETCDRFDVRDRLDEIEVPTLALCGEDDPLTPPEFHEYLAEELPDGTYREIAGAAHMPMLEQPDAFDSAVGSFVGNSE